MRITATGVTTVDRARCPSARRSVQQVDEALVAKRFSGVRIENDVGGRW
jgi:hypothetical protein